jgi:hypothetical protein
MASSGMLRRVALVRTDVSEELSSSLIRVTRIGIIGTTLAATSNRRTLLLSVRPLLVAASVVPSSPILVTQMKEALRSSETSVLTRVTQRNIPEDAILQRYDLSKVSTQVAPISPNFVPATANINLKQQNCIFKNVTYKGVLQGS